MLVSIQCGENGIVPWFDEPQFFREIAVVTVPDDGVWIVADYNGAEVYVSQREPTELLELADPTQVLASAPAYAIAGEPFTVSGTVRKGDFESLIFYFGGIPVLFTVVDGAFSREVTIKEPADYALVKIINPPTGEELLFKGIEKITVVG